MGNSADILKPLNGAFETVMSECDACLAARLEECAGDKHVRRERYESIVESYNRYLRGKYLIPGEMIWRMSGGDPFDTVFANTIEEERTLIQSMNPGEIYVRFVSDEALSELHVMHADLYDEMIRVRDNGKCKPVSKRYENLRSKVRKIYERVSSKHKKEALEQVGECLMYIDVIYGVSSE